MNGPPESRQLIEGIVTARQCECCGHHEMGITTSDGAYLPLKPGMRVRLLLQESSCSPE